jgi:hypothetical protein
MFGCENFSEYIHSCNEKSLFLPNKIYTTMAVLGLIFFFCIFGLGFWMLVYLFGVAVPYWITLAVKDAMKKKN